MPDLPGVDMNPILRELVTICLFAAFCSGVAWTYDHAVFAAVFGAASVIAGIEAIRRVL
jgi:hypothetical protein